MPANRTVTFEGRQYNFPADATDDEIAQALEAEHPAPAMPAGSRAFPTDSAPALPQRRQPQGRPWPQVAADAINTTMNGLTFGLQADLQGIVAGAADAAHGGDFGQTYLNTRNRVRAGQDQLRQEAPFASGALEGAGATVPMLLTMGESAPLTYGNQASRLAPQVARQVAPRGLRAWAGQTGRGILTGGGMGLAYGLGTGDGGPVERVEQALPATVFGAVAGGAAPTVVNAVTGGGRIIGSGVNAVRDMLPFAVEAEPGTLGANGGNLRIRPRQPGPRPTIPRPAAATLRRVADRAGVSADEFAARATEARRNPQGQVTADLLGDPGQRTTAALAQGPGKTGQRAADVLLERGRNAEDAITGTIRGNEGGFGVGAQSTASALSDLDAAEQTVFNDYENLWRGVTPEHNAAADAAYQSRLAPMLETNRDLLRPAMRRAINSFTRRTGSRDIDSNIGQFLHILKVSIGEDAYAAGVERQGQRAGDLRAIYNEVNQFLGGTADHPGAVPGYRTPVQAEQSIIQARRAVETGRSWLRQDHNFIRSQLQGMSEAERYYARVGLAEEIANRASGEIDGAVNVAKRFANNNIRRRIAAAFDNPEQAANFLDDVLRTQKQLMENAGRWNRGSPTWSNASHGADETLNTAADMGVDLAMGRPASAAGRAVRAGVNHTVGRVIEGSNNQKGAALLTRVDTQDSEAFAREVERILRDREALRRTNNQTSRLASRAGGTQGRRRP